MDHVHDRCRGDDSLMPWSDWQFWVVTVIAMGAGVLVIRPMLPKRFRRSPKGTRAQLTVKGRKIERRSVIKD